MSLKRLALSNCPRFDDAQLEKLLVLKNLREIVVKDCGLTPKSLATFKQFDQLISVILTGQDWPEAEKQKFRQCKFRCRFDSPKRKENDEKELKLKTLST